MNNVAEKLAELALEAEAIKLNAGEPFTWASGYRMPIYNDNRLLLSDVEARKTIVDGFLETISENALQPELIAGIATGGISSGTSLADRLSLPFAYVRSASKGHGLQNRVEGKVTKGQKVLIVEDLVSTGGSSLRAVDALRDIGAEVSTCLCIFSYGFKEAVENFQKSDCALFPLLSFSTLLEVAEKKAYISSDEQQLLRSWQNDPFAWGEANGFPRAKA